MTPARTTLVTGSSSGIGRTVALRLASDGFNVVLNGRNNAALEEVYAEITARECHAVIISGDVSKAEDVKKMVARTVEAFGELDVLVANAGVGALGRLVDRMYFHPSSGYGFDSCRRLPASEEDFNQTLATNIGGTFLCYKYAARQMIAQGKGRRIIGASSISGGQAESMLSAYSASKSAIRSLTQAAAAELGEHGINVNCYAAGPTDTPMIRNGYKEAGVPFELLAHAEANQTPLGRLGETEDTASVISFLASDAANWITGQTITVDGGRSLLGLMYRSGQQNK